MIHLYTKPKMVRWRSIPVNKIKDILGGTDIYKMWGGVVDTIYLLYIPCETVLVMNQFHPQQYPNFL